MGEKIRIQKIIAESGYCSRRKAEELIREGVVTINRLPAEIGQSVDPSDCTIRIGSRVLAGQQKKVTFMMNKPKGIVCSNDDPVGFKTVFDLMRPDDIKRRIYCAGRLDMDSEGLMILTNDGKFANKLTHPSRSVIKRYHVELSKPFDRSLTPKLLKGRSLDDEWLKFDKVIAGSVSAGMATKIEVHLNHGKRREIRRLMESFGYFIRKLKRFQVGDLVMKKLGPGKYRELTEKEIKMLM